MPGYIYIYQSDGYMKYHEIIHPFLSNFHNLWVCLKMGYTHKWLWSELKYGNVVF